MATLPALPTDLAARTYAASSHLCQVTVYPPDYGTGHYGVPCNQPTVTHLCAHHEAERVRLGGGS